MNLSPIINQPVGVGLPHLTGQHRPGACPFSSPGCWSYGHTEALLIRGRDIIVPGCGGTLTLSRGATLTTRWLRDPANHE